MTDRELLELAAKVAGYNAFSGHAAQMVDSGWNPLTDDGDALRLAVKLHIDFKCYGDTVRTWVGDVVQQRVIASIELPCEGDPYAATRRAIVRAAAEIGREMQ